MTPKRILPFFWVFTFFLAQNALAFIFPQRTPLLVLSAVLFYAFAEGPVFGALLGAYAGLLLEVFGAGRLGAEILVFAAAGFIFGRSTKTFFRESVFVQLLMPVLIFYLAVLSRFFVLYLVSDSPRDFRVFREFFLPWDALGMMAVCPVVFFFLKKVSDRT